jgi:beta-glucosidase
VLSDWIFGTHEDSAVNGLDIEMPFADEFKPLLDQVRSGAIPEAVVDDAVRRMVRKKLQYALGESSPVDESVVESDEHLAVAQEAAAEGAVLLKNREGALPLNLNGLSRIAVVGALADEANIGDTGSSSVRPSFVITPLQGFREALGDSVAIDYIGKESLDEADLATIASADAVIIVTGLTSEDEGEGLIGAGDRVDLGLGQERTKLILDAAAANERAIVVLEGGGAITVGDWLSEVEALLMVWYPGQMGGYAIADLVFGAANPSGKLPITFPTGLDQLPPFDNTSLEVTYDYFHGYRYLDRNDYAPEFAFGFGLSYTSFTVDNLRSDRAEVESGDTVTFTVDVTNEGPVAGAEVVQLYVGSPGSAVERAERELKGFAKVGLEPGETRSVDISVPVDSLAYYDVSRGAWALEGLEHIVHVGVSSRDLPLSTTLKVNEKAPL